MALTRLLQAYFSALDARREVQPWLDTHRLRGAAREKKAARLQRELERAEKELRDATKDAAPRLFVVERRTRDRGKHAKYVYVARWAILATSADEAITKASLETQAVLLPEEEDLGWSTEETDGVVAMRERIVQRLKKTKP